MGNNLCGEKQQDQTSSSLLPSHNNEQPSRKKSIQDDKSDNTDNAQNSGKKDAENSTQAKTERPQQRVISLEDFEQLKTLGEGGFGKVVKVREKSGKHGPDMRFALKQVQKSKLAQANLKNCAVLEKQILLTNQHQYIIKLFYSWQDNLSLYICMELCEGGDLYQIMRRKGRFPESTAQGIIAEVISALQHLHQKMNIMYRDIKPENILVTNNGHVKLADFGLSKQFKAPQEQTYTFLGTIEYLAPEIIETRENQRGYDQSVDIWGAGIFLYELIMGKTPFVDSSLELVQKRMFANKIDFPEKVFSSQTKDFIKSMLKLEPTERLGYYDFKQIKKHPFFNGIQWNELQSPAYTAMDGPLQAEVDITLGSISQKSQENVSREILHECATSIDPGRKFVDFTYTGSLLEAGGENILKN